MDLIVTSRRPCHSDYRPVPSVNIQLIDEWIRNQSEHIKRTFVNGGCERVAIIKSQLRALARVERVRCNLTASPNER